MIKKILFLAPYSVPVNNPEAICNAKLLKILSEAGYEIDVISKNNNHVYIPNTNDNIFIENVFYIKQFILKNKINIKTIIDHIKVFIKTGYVYKGAHWALYAINHSETLIKDKKYDLIMSRSPSAELAALYLSKKYKIKWIANWNDPYPDICYPPPYGHGPKAKLGGLQKKLLQKVSQQANIHTFPSKRLRDYMFQYMSIKDINSTFIIPHACIDNLFNYKEKEKSSILRIIHSGNITYPRSPISLFKGLNLFKEQAPNANIEITFIGKQDENFTNLIKNYNLDDNINIITPKDYITNLEIMSKFDLALLIEANMEEGIFLPTKLGDYMQCRLPIWTISPKTGEANDLYKDRSILYFSDVSSHESIADSLKIIYSDYLTKKSHFQRRNIIEEYQQDYILNLYKKIFNIIENNQ
ncbi:glycosyltransferase [Parabacteroides faecis]|uniref:Glycosyltransferase family 4 protein n=1 Tax=Parabacteroides faecis TaxID=1217282 RepID=A0ABR6KHY4_9BACT|nr:glycosyltransferase [Parabacteroides faecis]MBB4621122.1 hypothetical protein [Parabacteroides faecis]GGJ89014.1 hypothetical protein GCM10007084_10900 [Parabacteroides faecis]